MRLQKSSQDLLFSQVHSFITSFEEINKKRTASRPKADYKYIEYFFNRVIEDRNKRADDIDTLKHQKSVKIAKKLLYFPTEMESCMDGRIFGPLIGLYGHIGQTLSLAGGILHDFVRTKEDQKLHLLPNANFAKLLKKHFEKASSTSLVEIFDSHLGCAAREAEEIAKGRYPKDHGLLADVTQKLEMCNAMVEFVDKKYQGKKAIYPINISLDPHNGFLYMGLATKRALLFARKNGGFTQDVLDALVKKGWIVSTKQLTQEREVKNVFEKHVFPIDITHTYGESAHAVWEHVSIMQEKLLPFILKKLLVVYPHIKNDKKRQKELHERAMVILVNAFTGFLHQKQYPQYPYAEHHEEGVLVAKGDNPPYKVALFGESSLDMKNLPNNIELAASIVRNNRKLLRVVDTSGFFKRIEDFIEAPIGVIVQVKILEALPTKEWEKLFQIDWFKLLNIPWETMDDSQFMDYLESTMGSMPLTVANAINKLRKRTAMLYDIDQPIASHLIEHDIVVLPIISDVSKRVRTIIPFIKTGF